MMWTRLDFASELNPNTGICNCIQSLKCQILNPLAGTMIRIRGPAEKIRPKYMILRSSGMITKYIIPLNLAIDKFSVHDNGMFDNEYILPAFMTTSRSWAETTPSLTRRQHSLSRAYWGKLRYESSTLILCKELSSSIFALWVCQALVTPAQISTFCNI